MARPVLHRCLTRTDRLCPCGRVARELRRHGLEFDEVRHARRERDPVVDLTGQPKLPVLVIDGHAIVDSHRIAEHLEWRAARA